MSIYTNAQNIKTKEALTVIRNPGNTNDGTCPDRVLFTNPENEYCGKLMGQMLISNCHISSCDISSSTFHYEGISGNDMTFCISDMLSATNAANEAITSANAIVDAFAELRGISSLASISTSSTLQDALSAIACIRDMLSAMHDAIVPNPPSSDISPSCQNNISTHCNEDDNVQVKTCTAIPATTAIPAAKTAIPDANAADNRRISAMGKELSLLQEKNSKLQQENESYLVKISELVFENAELKSQIDASH